MTRSPRAWNASPARALLLALLAALPLPAQELASLAPDLLVSVGPAPTLDGRLDEGEWKGAAEFTVRRGPDVFADGWVRRVGRQLYLALDAKISPWRIGMRISFAEAVSGRTNLVMVTPVDPPRPPLVLFRQLVGREPERVPASTCDARFVLWGREGFSCELRVPLDLLEIVPTDRTYKFWIELWEMGSKTVLAAYPQNELEATAQATPAVLRSEGAWGAGEPTVEAPPGNDAFALLEELEDESVESGFYHAAGWEDGRRKDAAVTAFAERAERAAAACPDIISVRTFLVQARVACNDPKRALAAVRELGAFLPPIAGLAPHLMTEVQMLRDLGRYEEALAVIANHAEELKDNAGAAQQKVVLEGLRDAWTAETAIRKAEASRDDLPRVRLKTTKGDIDLELFEDDAPNGVANFIALVESGFYDGTRFHWADGGGRVIGGDPNSKDDDPHNDGYGDPGYLIESEPGRRFIFPMTVGFTDKRRQRRTEGSAFAIHLSSLPTSDGVNTLFGRVIAGENVALRLEYDDTIEKASVLRKRPHPYIPVKR